MHLVAIPLVATYIFVVLVLLGMAIKRGNDLLDFLTHLDEFRAERRRRKDVGPD